MNPTNTSNAMMPKKELELQEKRIERIRKYSTKKYEAEQRQMAEHLKKLPVTQKPTLNYPCTSQAEQGSSPSELYGNRLRKLHSVSDDQTDPKEICGSSTDAAYQQLRQIYLMAVEMVSDAESSHKPGVDAMKERRKSKQASNSTKEDRDTKDSDVDTPSGVDKGSRKAKTIAELKAGTGTKYLSLPVSDSRNKDRKEGFAEKRLSKGFSSDKRNSDSSVEDDESGSKTSKAVQVMKTIRDLCIGEQLTPAQMRGLTRVLEEAKNAVDACGKADGASSDKIQVSLIKKMNELLLLIKPTYCDTMSPEEILNCGYLRLTKDNVDYLEEILREDGFEPGLHAHTDVNALNDRFMQRQSSVPESSSVSGQPQPKAIKFPTPQTLQPTVFETKMGSPLSKKACSKPDGVHVVTETALDKALLFKKLKSK